MGRAFATAARALAPVALLAGACRPPVPAQPCVYNLDCPEGSHCNTELGYCLRSGGADGGASSDGGGIDGATPEFDDPWWDRAWSQRMRLRFHNATLVSMDLVSFPVPVLLQPDSPVYAGARADGADLRVVDPHVGLIPHEIERWQPGGLSTLWVVVPEIPDDSAADYLLLYWDNPDAEPPEPRCIWPATHQLVLHMRQGTGVEAVADSSCQPRDLLRAGSGPSGVEGALGNALEVGADERIEVPSLSGAGFLHPEGSLTLLLRAQDWSRQAALLDHDEAERDHLFLQVDSGQVVLGVQGVGGGNPMDLRQRLPLGPTWELLTLTWRFSDEGGAGRVSLYRVGSNGVSANTPAGWRPSAQQLLLFDGSLGLPFVGAVDAVQIQAGALDAAQVSMQARALRDVFIVYEPAPVVADPERGGPAAQWSGTPVALYEFDEGEGALVHDTSGQGAPLDLQIADTASVTWREGALQVHAPTVIESLADADKIAQACQESGAFSIEVWLQPDHTLFDGPSRIVSYARDSGFCNFTLGQDLLGLVRENASYMLRLQTSQTDPVGQYRDAEYRPATPLAEERFRPRRGRTQVAFTYDGSQVCSYVDGAWARCQVWGGGFEVWEPNRLRLANDLDNTGQYNRVWLGTYYRVAIYCQALSGVDIEHNFAAGTEP